MTIPRLRMLRLCGDLILVLGLVVSGQVGLAGSDAAYEVAIESNVWVTVRDGVKLATDIYRPAKNGISVNDRFPVILQRTPYDKRSKSDATIGKYFASRGYAVVVQDTRGRFQSEGVWHMLTDDGLDGYDVCAWISQQSWSNNRIGMIGTSYVGGTQHAAALSNAPNLTTVIPVDAMSNMGYQSMRNAGAFELRFWNWIFTRAAEGSRQVRDPQLKIALEEMAANRRHYLLNLPTRPGMTPLKLAPEYETWLTEAMKHGGNDEFWAQNNIIDHPEQYKDIPVFLIGGWYDSWGGNTSANYKVLSKTLKSPVYLTMGPWIHGKQGEFSHGQVSFGQDAAIPDPLAWRLEWYDRWLKDSNNSIGRSAPFATPIRIFVMGTGDGHKTEKGQLFHGGYWRDEQEWPLARARPTRYYIHAGGSLSTEPPTETTSATSYTFDPANPVPTIGGNLSSAEGIMVQGGWDQRGGEQHWNAAAPIPLSARRDVLVFQSEPLAENLEVTGEIEVTVWASSSAVDTDFTAKLIDVYPGSSDFPGGFDLNLEDGIVRARYRDSLKKPTLLQPGEIYPMTIKLYPTSNIFKKGHRIRLDLSSSNFPRFDVNPNTGEPLGDHRRTAIATNTILHDREHPSQIVLPVIPGSR